MCVRWKLLFLIISSFISIVVLLLLGCSFSHRDSAVSSNLYDVSLDEILNEQTNTYVAGDRCYQAVKFVGYLQLISWHESHKHTDSQVVKSDVYQAGLHSITDLYPQGGSLLPGYLELMLNISADPFSKDVHRRIKTMCDAPTFHEVASIEDQARKTHHLPPVDWSV